MNIINEMFHEMFKPRSFAKGEAFEEFVCNKMFIEDCFDLLKRTSMYRENRVRFAEDSKEPDFMFRSRKSKKEFYVEAKYRSNFINNALNWCHDYQIKRYKSIDSTLPVYVVMGVGGSAGKPENVYLVPVRDIKYTNLFRSFLDVYEVYNDKPVLDLMLKY